MVLDGQRTELLQKSLKFLKIESDEKARVYIGGGTVLASRWHHRISTDIDLFTTQKHYDTLITSNIEDLLARGNNQSVRIEFHPSMIRCFTTNTEFSLAGGENATGFPYSGEFEASTGLEAHSTLEIIMRKIRARMLRVPRYLMRDAYDVVCCAIQEQDTMLTVLRDWLEPIEHNQVQTDLEDPSVKIDDSMPLINPMYSKLDHTDVLRQVLFGVLTSELNKQSLGPYIN